jgi:hypothetical protein
MRYKVAGYKDFDYDHVTSFDDDAIKFNMGTIVDGDTTSEDCGAVSCVNHNRDTCKGVLRIADHLFCKRVFEKLPELSEHRRIILN